MLAFGMNGEPLPVEHGFPVRMLIPGLYGYVSACKWLTGIEATTFDAFDAYWIERDWAAEAPDQGRLPDRHPRAAARVPRRPPRHRRRRLGADPGHRAGRGARSTRRTGSEAELSPEVDADLWRQWVLPYDFRPAGTRITVRAISSEGEEQVEARTTPFPSGSTGWHSIQVVAA